MALWQTVLGSVSGLMTGTVLACIGYYLHFRYIEKGHVSLRAVFLVLSGAKPRWAPSSGVSTISDRKQKMLLAPLLATRASAEAKESVKAASPVQDPNKEHVLELLSEFEHDLKAIGERSPKVLDQIVADVSDPNESTARHSFSDLANDLGSLHKRDLTPTHDQEDRLPRFDTTPPPSSTGDLLETLFPIPEQSKEDHQALIAEFERNIKTIREFSKDIPSLRTDAWEGKQSLVHTLPTDVRSELESIYTDIALLNNLSWLSSEFNRRSPSMLQQYVKLSTNVADRLDKIIRGSLFQAEQTTQAPRLHEQPFV